MLATYNILFSWLKQISQECFMVLVWLYGNYMTHNSEYTLCFLFCFIFLFCFFFLVSFFVRLLLLRLRWKTNSELPLLLVVVPFCILLLVFFFFNSTYSIGDNAISLTETYSRHILIIASIVLNAWAYKNVWIVCQDDIY